LSLATDRRSGCRSDLNVAGGATVDEGEEDAVVETMIEAERA
jgi:hypothetical protein